MRILVAEDELIIRTLVGDVLRKSGFDVVKVSNGAEAWEAMQTSDAPPLAILDWMMPELDGLEVVRRIRARTTNRPPYLILLTARDSKVDLVAGLQASANDYVSKPFDPRELLARVAVGRRMVELQETLAARIEELGQALEEIKTLRGILPICASCKKIRDDQGYWQQVEVYVHDHTDAQFSHGLCPECIRKLYPDMDEELKP